MPNGNAERLAFKYDSDTIEDFIDTYAVDITRNGFFIRTSELLSVGQLVEFELQLNDGSNLLSGLGTVAWIKPPSDGPGTTSGMGVRFERLPLASRKALDVILRPRDSVDAQRERESGSYPTIEGEQTKRRKSDSLTDVTIDEEALRGARRPATGPYLPPPTEGPSSIEGPAWLRGEEEEKTEGSPWVTWVVLALITGIGLWVYIVLFGPDAETAPAPAPTKPAAVVAPKLKVPPPPPAEPPTAEPPAETKQDKTKTAKNKAAPKEQPRAISWTIDSKPRGASIILDGRDTGHVTPVALPGLDPRFEIDLALDLVGRQLFVQRLKPSKAGLTAQLKPSVRAFNFVSTPSGATVYVNSRKMGKTPLLVKDRKLGHRGHFWIKVDLDGYHRFETNIRPAELKWTRTGLDEATTVRAILNKQ